MTAFAGWAGACRSLEHRLIVLRPGYAGTYVKPFNQMRYHACMRGSSLNTKLKGTLTLELGIEGIRLLLRGKKVKTVGRGLLGGGKSKAVYTHHRETIHHTWLGRPNWTAEA